MATWPASAKILHDGYAERRPTALMRTDMESGPPKQVRTKSRVMVALTLAVLFDTAADYADFLAWFANDLDQGSGWFDFTDPRTGTVRTARIEGGQLGEAVPLGAASAGPWRLPVTVEYWSA